MATVAMEDDAVLTEPRAKQVIQEAGYQVVSFAQGEPGALTAFLFRVGELSPGERASLERGLREDLAEADKVAVDSLGRASVAMGGDAAAAREALSASLEKRGVGAQDLETKTWPKLDATYEVAVSQMRGPVEARSVADALAGVPKVVAVHVYQEAGTALLWLKEPCDALEQNVRAALAPAGFSVARFERMAADG